MKRQNGFVDRPKSSVELSISCRNLRDKDVMSKSDPICAVLTNEFGTNSFHEIGRTEKIDNNLNPEWVTKIKMDYFFEEQQKLRFEVYDVDSNDSRLDAHCSFKKLVSDTMKFGIRYSLFTIPFAKRVSDVEGPFHLKCSKDVHTDNKTNKNPCSRDIRGRNGNANGKIFLNADVIEGSKKVALMQWSGQKLDKKDFLGKSDPFLLFYRINDDNSSTLVYRSDYIKNTLNPTWKGFRMQMRTLCLGDAERSIRIECFDYDNDGGHDFIGQTVTTVSRLAKGPGSENIYELINAKKQSKKKGYKNSGTLHLLKWEESMEYSFLDYIQGGTQMHFTVAVDFTASNGNPVQSQSLHYIHPHQPNQYMIALKSVGDIIADYDSDKMFPALGFGARLPSGHVSHEFFMNFHATDPHCHGVDGILSAYRQAIFSVQLYGPTNFSPVINHVARIAAGSGCDGKHYFVLLIITDGVITDFEHTKAAIVAASSLPMSIIIVGVGDDDFNAMDDLDADNVRLCSNGRFAERDIVQFVPLRNYIKTGNPEMSQARLAKEVLLEVPEQLCSWMRCRGIVPTTPIPLPSSTNNSLPPNPSIAPAHPHPPTTFPSAPPPVANNPPSANPPNTTGSSCPYPAAAQSCPYPPMSM